MSTEMKRYTISITPTLECALNEIKKEKYCHTTQSEMIRDLIVRGLSTVKDDGADEMD